MKPPMKDARIIQITFLGSLLVYGMAALDFPVTIYSSLSVLAATLAVQAGAHLVFQLSWNSLLSASISALSVLLLCRSQSLYLTCLCGCISVLSKFAFHWRGKHFFNPTNFAIITMLLLSDGVWVSPGQWGQGVFVTATVVALGISVVFQARRADISLVFLLTYAACLGTRVVYLGQATSVWWNQLQNGSLLIFTFFMISDPRSTPDHWLGRVVFAAAVAIIAYFIRYTFYTAQAPLWALFFLSPWTIALDHFFRHSRYQWRSSNEKEPPLMCSASVSYA